MLNTIDLEKRWFRYKIKSYIPHLIIFIGVLAIGVPSFIIFNPKENDDNKKKVLSAPVVKKELETKSSPDLKNVSIPSSNTRIVSNQILDTVKNVKIQNDEDIMFEPSLNFMQNMRNSPPSFYAMDSSSKVNTQNNEKEEKKKAPNKIVQTKEKIEEIVLEENPVNTQTNTKVQKDIQTSVITINRKEASDDINNVIKRFKVNNNPVLSLFISKKYYELGDYPQAYNYALITNQINRDIEASWIIFTKSLVKLDKRDQAIQTLKDYIKDSNSNSARILLEEIQSGKFK